MARRPFHVDPDLARAATPPGADYVAAEGFARQQDLLWPRVWQLAPVPRGAPDAPGACPFMLPLGPQAEPLVLTADESGELRCLSNVCTHRAMLVADEPTCSRVLRCPYHGRSFGLDGRMQHAPGFEGCEEFPTESDDLPRVPVGQWHGFRFAALQPHRSFEQFIAPAERWLGRWLAAGDLPLVPDAVASFEVAASWIVYVDNYLESFHVPFVHRALAGAVEAAAIRVVTDDEAVVQLAPARDGEPAIEPGPTGEGGLAAIWLWLFPTTMLNLYPWGLSINRVVPIAADRTQIVFESWVRHPSLRSQGAGSDLTTVELEDQRIVAATWRGLASRLYRRGRYAPRFEAGVHRFHRILGSYLAGRSELPDRIEF